MAHPWSRRKFHEDLADTNVGTCAWTPSFSFVFVDGDRLTAPASVGLSDYVNPGQTIDLSVNMIAPNQNGHYQGYWELRDPAGVLFGIGAQAQSSFWVDINVSGPTYTAMISLLTIAMPFGRIITMSCPAPVHRVTITVM